MNIRPLIFRFCLLLIVLLAGCHAAHNPHIASAVSEVNEVYLRAHIDKLTAIGSRFARHDTSSGALHVSNKTAQKQKLAYLARCFKDYGYRVWQPGFSVSGLRGGRGINLIAFKEGTVEPHRVLELGAHYDTIANPGADDNCSGVAGVLEAARVLAKIPTERSIRFCLYDLEEVGLLGSREHVKLLQDKADFLARDEIFDGAIVLETIGY
ncbi:MAG: M28 family peptidase, partial [bacterium]|nr:M28 family peptidase [bacterium]